VVIEQAFGSRKSMPGHALIRRVVTDSLILNSVSLPGYFVAALLIGRKTWGIQQSPRFVMMQGFAAMAILYFVIGAGWHALCRFPILLVCVYGLTFFFANYGPNTTTFILPSLVYSAECRSTLNGVSAACGKVGALVGATLFAPLGQIVGENMVMLMCAVTALSAFGMTQRFVRVRQSPSSRPDQHRGGYSVVNESSS
jgi:PHS family inorganic phosphate transporter-like MFS transporter